MEQTIFIALAMVLSLAYAWGNGANDCANTQATVVATDALPPRAAVILGGVMNALGLIFAWFIGSAVAKTIGKGIIDSEFLTEPVIIGGLIGAIAWVWFATKKKIPVSVTHSLIGGIVGAGLAHGGVNALANNEKMVLVVIGIFLAPILGFTFGYFFLYFLKLVVACFMKKVRHASANRFWRRAQLLSSSWLAFSHGMNDGQNAVGALAIAAVAGGFSRQISIEAWMVLPVALAIGIGTVLHGFGVIETAVKTTRGELEPIDGFASQTATALILTVKSMLGIPASTTHVAFSSIIGASGAKGTSYVDWNLSRHIGIAWVLTIPLSALAGGIGYALFSLFFG